MKKAMLFHHVSPLARRIVIYVVLASTFITIFTSAFQLYEIYKKEINGIEVRMNEVRDSYSNNIAARLWVANQQELNITLQGILRLPDLEYIEVYEGTELVAQQGVRPEKNIIEQDFPILYTYRNKPQQIGRLHITASLTNTYKHVIDQALAIIISNTIKTFLISGFMLFLFYRFVARHLITLGHFAETLNIDALDNKLKLVRKTKSGQVDELDHLANALISLQDRLKQSIREFKNSQTTLINSEAKFRGVLESAVDGIFMTDRKGSITLVNQALCDMTGYTIKELIGETIEILVPASVHHHNKLRQEYFQNPSERTMDKDKVFHACRKDGTQFPINISLSPVVTEEGMIVTAIMHDVTARIRIEKEREALLESLENKNNELERFTYTVSHDLKSPLVTITGFIGLLKKDISDDNKEKIESDFLRISDAANTMQELLNDLLELSRIGTGTSSCRDVPVNSIVDSVLEMLSSKIEASQAKITVEPNLPVIHVEEARFKEVYLNLIENAIKYRRDDVVPEISIGVRYDREKNNERVFFVKDNGLGIDPRYQEKIFELFERLSNEKEGTGVGLSIVKRILDVHNGKIWVESEGIGQGSTFNFVI